MSKIEVTIDTQVDEKESSIKFEVVEADTSAIGGLQWFPEGVIITFFGLVASGFINAIGADIYKKVKGVLKRILSKFRYGQNVYLTFKEGEYSLYFEISKHAIESDENVIDNIARDYPQKNYLAVFVELFCNMILMRKGGQLLF